jgi:butyryl-CoA dehydrogenase
VVRDSAAAFAREVAPLVEAADRSAAGEVAAARQILALAGKRGLLTQWIPRWAGGDARMWQMGGSGRLAMLAMFQEFAEVSPGLATLIGAHYLGAMPILLSFDFALARRLLAPLCKRSRQGDPAICAFAITEPEAGSDVEDREGARVARLCTSARRVSGGYRLRGRKCFISGGNLASLTTVFAALEPEGGTESWTCFAVAMDSPGVTIAHVEDKMGQRVSPTAELVFDDVFVPESHRVGAERSGWQLNRLTLDSSRPLVAGLALGGARRVIDLLLAQIGASGALAERDVQHEVADLIGRYAAAQALTERAVERFPPRGDLSALAKFVATDAAVHIASRALDLLGPEAAASGEIERLYRDLRLTQIYEGTNEINRFAVFEYEHARQPLTWREDL